MAAQQFLKYNPFKSLTIWGAVGVIVSVLLQAFDPHALGPTGNTVIQAAGILVGALGLRNAHAKSVREIADLVSGLAAKSAGQPAASPTSPTGV